MHARFKLAALSASAVALLQLTGCDQGAQEAEVVVASQSAPILAENVCANDEDPACTPTGLHAQHEAGNVACTVCHARGGRVAFRSAYFAAQHPGRGVPTFDATTKNCSNVACHSVPAGTYPIWVMDGAGDVYQELFPYGGPSTAGGGGSLNWYTAGPVAGSCGACHYNAPRAPVGVPTYYTATNPITGQPSYAWHSGYHGGQGPTGDRNQCQLCHRGATGSGGVGVSLVSAYASDHGNGVVNVDPKWSLACRGCH